MTNSECMMGPLGVGSHGCCVAPTIRLDLTSDRTGSSLTDGRPFGGLEAFHEALLEAEAASIAGDRAKIRMARKRPHNPSVTFPLHRASPWGLPPPAPAGPRCCRAHDGGAR